MLVQRDVDTLTAATDSDAGIALALLNCQSAGMSKVGIVTAVLVVGTEILIGDTHPVKPTLDGLFGLITGMVAAQCHGNAGFDDGIIHIFLFEWPRRSHGTVNIFFNPMPCMGNLSILIQWLWRGHSH
jgi:hypothetical protein